MKQYTIDSRLEAVCLPLSKDEYDLLESQIKRDGVLDAVKVWDRDGELVLLDGHNRLKICKDNKLPIPESTTVEIDSIDEAVIWICDNQKGRRNVATPKQQEYISGKRYEAQRNIDKFKGNQYTKESGAAENQPDQMDKTQHPTAFKQGLDEGIGQWKVRENARFAKGVDAVREISPEIADKILKPSPGTPKLTKRDVIDILKIPTERKKEIVVGGIEKIKSAINDVRTKEKEDEEQRKFAEFSKRVAEKTAIAHAKIDRVYKAANGACLLPNVSELFCDDCQWGFDAYLPAPHAISCPYCKGDKISKRDDEWNSRELV
jgi:hypothetical protein